MLQWDEKPPWGASLNESKRGLQQSVFDLPPPTLPPAFYFLSFHTFFFSLQHWSLAGLWACLRSVTRQQLYSSGYQDNAVRFTLWFHEGLIDWDWEGGERDGEGEIVATAGGGLIRKRGGDGRTFQAPRDACDVFSRHKACINAGQCIITVTLCALGEADCCLREGCIMRSPSSVQAGWRPQTRSFFAALNSVCQGYLWRGGMHDNKGRMLISSVHLCADVQVRVISSVCVDTWTASPE